VLERVQMQASIVPAFLDAPLKKKVAAKAPR
jgi:hypothetical protein